VHDHPETLALAAAAIDFELDPVERSQLEAALETCPLCRRQAAAMRATATILRRPSDIGTPGRVRDVVIGAAIGRGRRTPPMRSLLAASLSLLVLLGGTAVIVGNRGFNLLSPASPSGSTPVQTAAVQASPTASPPTPTPLSPTASPTPTVQPSSAPPMPIPNVSTGSPSPVDDGPLRPGEVAAMVTDGRLVIRTQPGTGAGSAIFKTRIYPGQRVLTLEGPVEAGGYPWFRVRVGTIEGWVAAAGREGEPWLMPVRNGLIAYVRGAADASGEAILTAGPDGSAGGAVLFADPGLVHFEQLTWSPDGQRLAFVATPAGSATGSTEVYTIDADGTNLVQITQNNVDDDSPAWSPDSTLLALRVDAVDPSAPVGSSVVVTPVVGPGVTVLGPGANPAWSPDGQQIVMTVAEGGSSRLWLQAPDGEGRRQVAEVSVAPIAPAWSPDGQLLVVSSSSGLVVVDIASGSITPLTAEPGLAPTWSLAAAIAFSTTGSASPGIFVIDSDGSNSRRVLADVAYASILQWSPDGRRLLLGDDTGESLVAVADPGSGNLTLLVTGVGGFRSPAWQPRLP
jgi:hypothetical protein